MVYNQTMDKMKETVREHLAERGWDNLDPGDLSKSIVIEAAELLEVFQWDNTNKDGALSPDKLEKVKKELADVLIYCFEMGIMLDLDLEQVMLEKLAKVKEKYPVSLFNKESGANFESYIKIKQEYRKEGKN
jgi:NTP pyrophosphatase (non-canonical NTP hydrolase)